MNTTEVIDLFSAFYPPEFLKSKLEGAVKFLPEEIDAALPSIQLGSGGLTLSSLILVTNNYLCEVRLNEGQSVCNFDIVAKHTVVNYRIKNWTHEIKAEGVVTASFEISEVTLMHGHIANFTTALAFAGKAEDREQWLANLVNVIPVKLVLGFSHPVD